MPHTPQESPQVTAMVSEGRPGNPWLRISTVVVVLSVIAGGMILGLAVARRLGINPTELQGAGFVMRPATVSIFLVFQAFQVIVVLIAQRLVHRRPLRELFGGSAVRDLPRGFAIGFAVTAAFYAAPSGP